MRVSELPLYQSIIAIVFIALGILVICLRTGVEAERGRKGRVTWLIAGAYTGPAFGLLAFLSRMVTPQVKAQLNQHPIYVAVGTGALIGLLWLVLMLLLLRFGYRTVPRWIASWNLSVLSTYATFVGLIFLLALTGILAGLPMGATPASHGFAAAPATRLEVPISDLCDLGRDGRRAASERSRGVGRAPSPTTRWPLRSSRPSSAWAGSQPRTSA